MYGLAIVKASPKLKRGTIYVTLDRMTNKGLVSSRQEDAPSPTGSRRRLYQITGIGQAIMHAQDAFEAAYTAGMQGVV